MLKETIMSICQQSLTDDELRKAIEAAITESIPYNHEGADTLSACGLNEEDARKNNDDLESVIESIQEEHGKSSQVIEAVEKHMSKRQLSFMFYSHERFIDKILSNPLVGMLLDMSGTSGSDDEEEEPGN